VIPNTFHKLNSKSEYRNSKQIQNPKFEIFNLETAAGRKKDVQDIGVHGEIQKVVVTFVVMRHFCILPGAPRACTDFCDPTAVSRFNSVIGSLQSLYGRKGRKFILG